MARLLANGDVDPTFAAELPADTSLRVATDIAVDTNTGSIIVVLDDFGNSRDPGLVVARLQADGALDPLFGEGGVTWVDLPGLDGNAVSANPGDVTVLDNSDVLVSGGSATAFVARLVGGSGNDSPGVLGVRNIRVDTTEEAQEAVVTVRRMGGKTGSVSATYEAHATPGDVYQAIEGQDFTAVSGRLDWADGDGADKQIVVPIAPDADRRRKPSNLRWSSATSRAGPEPARAKRRCPLNLTRRRPACSGSTSPRSTWVSPGTRR